MMRPPLVGVAVFAGFVGLKLVLAWLERYRLQGKHHSAGRRKRAELSDTLARARAELPPRPLPQREEAVIALHAHQLAAAIKQGAAGPQGITAVEAMTVYCHRALCVSLPSCGFLPVGAPE